MALQSTPPSCGISYCDMLLQESPASLTKSVRAAALTLEHQTGWLGNLKRALAKPSPNRTSEADHILRYRVKVSTVAHLAALDTLAVLTAHVLWTSREWTDGLTNSDLEADGLSVQVCVACSTYKARP